MRRRTILAGALAAGGAALGALWPRPEATRGIPRIGLLDLFPRGDKDGSSQLFVNALTKLGYVEGTNIEYLHRYPEASREVLVARYAALADELVRAGPDAIVANGTWATKALARATTAIPIVTNVGDPVGAGFAKSLARPGGNITGVAVAPPEIYLKTFEYLKAIIPGDWSLAMVVGDAIAETQPFVLALQDGARKCAIPTRTVNFKGLDAVQADRALASMRGQGVRAVSLWTAVAGIPDEDYALLLATKYGLVNVPEGDVSTGALLAYVVADDDVQERKALQMVKILRGAPPAEIPFDTPRRFRLMLNRKTAGLLGLTIPREVLVAADKVQD